LDMGSFAGRINATAPIFYVDIWCNSTNFSNFTVGSIALMKRGNCTFAEKVTLANQAKAAGVIIFNNGYQGTDPFIGSFGSMVLPIPAFSLSQELGIAFQEIRNLTLSMIADATLVQVNTTNIIADTPGGIGTSIIVVGSHLDSVPAGPGINDNGSGSSANLELALQLFYGKFAIKNKVRFCWWAAEEKGLLGSTYYVSQLNSTELATIALNLNFDMLGSPNFFRGVYNGYAAEDVAIRNASGKIQTLFELYFDTYDITHETTPFTGRSDYGPFITHGIPAGGLFTGAEGMKSMEQRALYGGIANAAYDPCYHQACDSIPNINQQVLLEMSQAAAFTLQTLAQQDNLRSYLVQ